MRRRPGVKHSCAGARLRVVSLILFPVFCGAAAVHSQVLINEVIADNQTTGPQDIGGATPDMIELYNTSDEAVALGHSDEGLAYYLADSCGDDIDDCAFDDTLAWRFPPGTIIAAKGFLVVFCDGSAEDAKCELHASFEVASNGEEPVVLWGPEDSDGDRPMVDRVWLPPLDPDVSFARQSDGAGGANLPLDQIFDFFVHSPDGEGTFGSCTRIDTPCVGGDPRQQRVCLGEPNDGKEGDHRPKIEFADYSTNHPAAGEPVVLWVEVRDDDTPVAPNITRVEISYSVDGDARAAPMVFEELRDESAEGRPLAFYSVWRGEIPALPAGSLVEFTFFVDDVGPSDPREIPDELCRDINRATVVGPCNELGLPGTDCIPDDMDPERRFEDCTAPYRYRVAHDPGPELRRLVINEIVPLLTRLIEDTTDDNFEDYIELYNGSAVEIDLGGLWLSDRPFEPQGTPFPQGARIAPGQYVIVWLDDDGYRCPRPDDYDESDPDEPQKCEDPTDPATNRYHTNFRLSADGEQIYLFDRVENGLGLIHGYEFEAQETADLAFALCPDGDPNGTFVVQDGSPRAPNTCVSIFRRGDANGDCTVNLTDPVFHLASLFQGGQSPPCDDAADANDDGGLDISDPVFVLNYLFSGGADPNAPGPDASGPDPTADSLTCVMPPGCP